MTRYATSRQKSCHQCSSAKTKCDRKNPSCTRCVERSQTCTYTQAAIEPELQGSHHKTSARSASSGSASPTAYTPAQSVESTVSITSSQPGTLLDFSRLSLICPINAEEISSRWLNPYVSVPGQRTKTYPPSVTSFLNRVLRSYASIAIQGHELPPFIHSTQVQAATTATYSANSPLSVCFSLIKICERPLPGSETTSISILQQEMSKLVTLDPSTTDHTTQLAAFQAYLIYSMILFFRFSQPATPTQPYLRDAMMNLQHLACQCASRGIICAAEQAKQQTRPRWEEWIVAEATRRTIYTVYLLDSMSASQEGLPTFLGTELRGLPAPGSGILWRASSRADWERGYNAALAEWSGEGGLRIDELWPVPVELDEGEKARRSERIDRWLRDVDAYGTMLYATTSATHGT